MILGSETNIDGVCHPVVNASSALTMLSGSSSDDGESPSETNSLNHSKACCSAKFDGLVSKSKALNSSGPKLSSFAQKRP